VGAERLRGVIALDGPSGTGKSTVARKLARELGARYLDTGSMYRAITLAVLRAGADPAGEAAVRVALGAPIEVGIDPGVPGIRLYGGDVGAEIRGGPVTSAVSVVSAHPRVRVRMVELQRRIIADAVAEFGGIVVEGRDIGTVVAPDAPLKIYLTASAEVRASRRGGQDRRAGRRGDYASTLLAVQRRDALDSGRADSPMRPAQDAITLDTSDLDLAGVLTALRVLVDQLGLLDTDRPSRPR
jgi:cytidylate kinase